MITLLKIIILLDIAFWLTILALKLIGILAWAMVWVMAPIWIPAVLIFLFCVFISIVAEDF